MFKLLKTVYHAPLTDVATHYSWTRPRPPFEMFCATLFCVVFVCTTFTGVASHGYVHSVILDGQEYPGWFPFSDAYLTPPPQRIVRKISNDGFVAADDPDLPCHHGGNDGAAIVADATAGSQVRFFWSYWPADHQGPVSTYMASCNGDCTTFLASNARWFKLDAAGYDPSTRFWAADQLRANNNSWVSIIPSDLAPGQYLLRNEIVALHSVTPQFYPSCAQVEVSSSGSSQPSQDDLVSIPGLYSGVSWPNIYSDFGTFAIPGPPPVTFGAGGGTTSQIIPTSVPTMTAGTSVGSLTPTGQCVLSRRTVKHNSRR